MFYLIIFVILFILALLNLQMHDKLSTQVFTGVSALILIAIAGLRYETGGDWESYGDIFNGLPPLSRLLGQPKLLTTQPVEEGFTLLCASIKALGGTIQHLFFVVTTINITLICAALPKYTKYPVVALFCYYGILYFQLEMVYIRQATAVALCFFALQYIKPKQIGRYMLLVVLACTFHRVAVLMIPLYFFLDRQLPAWVYWAVIGAGAVMMLAGIPWIKNIFFTFAGWLGGTYTDKAEEYAENALFAVNRRLSIGFMLNLAIFAVVMVFKKRLEELKYGTIMLNMFVLSLALYYYCYELVEVSNRTRLFFFISVIALLPMLLEVMPLFLERFAGMIVIMLYCFSFSRGIFLEQPQSVAYNPYQNYIEFKINPRPSTGKQRLEQSNRFFKADRQ